MATSVYIDDAVEGPQRRQQIMNSSDTYNPTSVGTLKTYDKSESSKSFLRKALRDHYLFEGLGEDDMKRIIDSMRPTFSHQGDKIIVEGELGDLFYTLESGDCGC